VCQQTRYLQSRAGNRHCRRRTYRQIGVVDPERAINTLEIGQPDFFVPIGADRADIVRDGIARVLSLNIFSSDDLRRASDQPPLCAEHAHLFCKESKGSRVPPYPLTTPVARASPLLHQVGHNVNGRLYKQRNLKQLHVCSWMELAAGTVIEPKGCAFRSAGSSRSAGRYSAARPRATGSGSVANRS